MRFAVVNDVDFANGLDGKIEQFGRVENLALHSEIEDNSTGCQSLNPFIRISSKKVGDDLETFTAASIRTDVAKSSDAHKSRKLLAIPAQNVDHLIVMDGTESVLDISMDKVNGIFNSTASAKKVKPLSMKTVCRFGIHPFRVKATDGMKE